MSALTQTDLANAAKLLERLRTGELNLIPSVASLSERKEDAGTAMLQRVEAFLSEGIRRMDAPIGDGGPAFAQVAELSQNQSTGETTVHQASQAGMTLRDYFAGKAVGGLLAERTTDGDPLLHDHEIAELAYSLADAMLKARSL